VQSVEDEQSALKKPKQKKSKPGHSSPPSSLSSSSSSSSISKSTPTSKKETSSTKRKASASSDKPLVKEVLARKEHVSLETTAVTAPTGTSVKTYYPKIPFDHMKLAKDLSGA
jgi:hypothetical protein